MDNTKRILTSFIENTQYIAENALKILDKNSWFRIVPSIDMGVPYDVDRLAGGFPTGVFIEWRCNVPIIPIDATVNCCTASVFSVSFNYDEELFIYNLRNLSNIWSNSSYLMNFDRGNHFISLCSDINGRKFLVMHSTAKEFCKGYNGLYPTKGNWYYEKIKIYEQKGRYFRYIQGKEAELFVKTAISLNRFNEIRHENIAYSLLKNDCDYLTAKHYHHYGMEESESIKIGCYTIKEGDIFPLFSKPYYPIDLYEVKYCSNKNAKGDFIIPHGWGKEFINNVNLSVDIRKNSFSIENYQFKLFNDESIYDLPIVKYRDFEEKDGSNGFYNKFKKELTGNVKKILRQEICLTYSGIWSLRSGSI